MAGLLMDADHAQVLRSFILCGNGISKRNLQLLSSHVRSLVEDSPEILVTTLKQILCEFDSHVVSTRILVRICGDLQDITRNHFRVIVEAVLTMLTNEQTSSILAAVHNAVFLLPVHALSSDDASEISKRIVGLLPVFQQNDSLQIVATSLSQFVKKWATIIPNPEIPTMSLLSIMPSEGLTYSVLSLLSQSAVYLFLALIGDSVNLKEMVGDLFEKKPTILDRCTSVSQIRFMDYALQSLPRAVLLQMVGCFLYSLSEARLNEVADRFPLLQPCIQRPPQDALGLTCYYTMLSAVLRATAKQLTPKALNMCAMALLACPHPRDNASRRATRSCLSTILQCSSHISDQKRFNEMLFNKIMKLPPKSVFRQDALPLIIPAVGFHCITPDFFQSLVSLFDSHTGQAVRCMYEVYKTFDVPKEYTFVLLRKLDQMNSATRLAILANIGKAGPKTISVLQEHVASIQGLEENRRLALQLALVTTETKNSRRTSVSLDLLRKAIHSWDFEIRMSALRLLCARPDLNEEAMEILYEAVPRLFVYSDIEQRKQLEGTLSTITSTLQGEKGDRFVTELFDHLIPLLRPEQSGVRKAYLVTCLKIAWMRKPLFLLSMDLMEHLIMGLFESSYPLRDEVFRTLLLIIKSVKTDYEISLVNSLLNDQNHFTTGLIEKYKDSERFREADGAARLMALLNIVKKEISCDSLIAHIYSQFLQEYKETRDTIPSHFPLSVILHYLQSSAQETVDMNFMTSKLIPFLLELIRDSLAFIGVEYNVESMPVQSIVSVKPPESQLQLSATKSWLAVRQALNIIAWILRRYFDSISCDLVKEIGNTLFNFLVDSHHYSTVYYAHLTFQMLCSFCFMRNDRCAEFPLSWCDSLIEAAGTFTSGDHRCSGAFVQTAMALIHSEPANLFGSQRGIYHKFVKMCIILLDHPGSDKELLSALLLTEAIAADSQTRGYIEPYSPQLVMAVLAVNCHCREKLEIIRTANRCLKLLMKLWQSKEDTREHQQIQHSEFFENVRGSLDFFHEHLTPDQSDIAYVILQVIQMMHPFRDRALMMKIANLRDSKLSRVRQAAARCLLVVLPFEQAESFVRKAIRDLRILPSDVSMISASPEFMNPPSLIETDGNIEEMELADDDVAEDKLGCCSESESEDEIDFNTCDGIILQIQQIIRRFPSVKETLMPDIQFLCSNFLEKDSANYLQVYAVVQLAREFGCLSSLAPLLRRLSKMSGTLKALPMGHRLLRASFSVLDDNEMIAILQGQDDSAILHLLLQMKVMSPAVESVCIDVFLRDRNQTICDLLAEMFLRSGVHPSPAQKQRFQEILLETCEDQRLEVMLNLAPMFTPDAKAIFRHFKEYAEFVDRSDSNVMGALSNLALCFKDELFSTFDEDDYTHWKTALRLISDENPAVRGKCARALSSHFSGDHASVQQGLELCEYDLIQFIYAMIGEHSIDVLETMLDDFRTLKSDLDCGEFKQEPAHFLHPPSFHTRCIKKELKKLGV